MAKPATWTLTDLALQELRLSLDARNRLQFELGKSSMTIYRWIEKNDPKLTQYKAVKIISEETGIPKNELLQPRNKETI